MSASDLPRRLRGLGSRRALARYTSRLKGFLAMASRVVWSWVYVGLRVGPGARLGLGTGPSSWGSLPPAGRHGGDGGPPEVAAVELMNANMPLDVVTNLLCVTLHLNLLD